MPQFSFRAECAFDVGQFIACCSAHGVEIELSVNTLEEGFPDVSVDMTADTDIERLRSLLDTIQDSYVMLQTLRQVPLKENSLERDHTLWPKANGGSLH